MMFRRRGLNGDGIADMAMFRRDPGGCMSETVKRRSTLAIGLAEVTGAGRMITTAQRDAVFAVNGLWYSPEAR